MKKKRFTISKIVLFIPYFITFALLGFMFFEIKTGMNYQYINYTEVAFVATLGVCGYVTKWYLKKSSLENEPKVRLGVMQELLKLQQENPSFNIYDKVQMRQDAQDIVRPIKNDEQRTYEKVVTEDTDTKIS